jgi:hypothetical protein
MRINSIEFRNFGSYGNRFMELDLPEDPGFFLIQGRNGNGKCLSPDTAITIKSSKEDFEKFSAFLELYKQKGQNG